MSFLFSQGPDLAQTLDSQPRVESPPGEKGAHLDLKGIKGQLPIPRVPGLWGTHLWSMKTYHQPKSSWGVRVISHRERDRRFQDLGLLSSQRD